MTTEEILIKAKNASKVLSTADSETKNNALKEMAASLLEFKDEILEANKIDVEASKGIISDVMIDRLSLSPSRIKGMANGILEVVSLSDPVGKVVKTNEPPSGIHIEKVLCPMGVIAIIYESRPNVTSDAAALALKAGSACVLRCGKEAHNSALAIVKAMKAGIKKVGLPEDIVCLVEDTSRASAEVIMKARGLVDLLIPRGGKGLITNCVENSKVPVLATGTGICHIYVDETADFDKALRVLENAKCSRPSVCNAAEVVVVNEKIADVFLPLFKNTMVDLRREAGKIPVELVLDEAAARIIPGTKATSDSFDTEFLDYKMAIKVVKDLKEAVAHISLHSTGHSEAIITENDANALYFIKNIDSAAVYVNCSTRFTDGGEFGLGCEMGISTQKLHARGPLGLEELCTNKFIIHGDGSIRV